METGPSRRPSEPSFDPMFGATFSFEPILSKNWNLRTYTRLVNTYTKRNLSVDSDAHRALVGMLNKVSQVTGENFAYGLLEENLVSCMLWEGRRSRRRSLFPSWTWLGWQGAARYKYSLQNRQPSVSTDGRKSYLLHQFCVIFGIVHTEIHIEITFCAEVINQNEFVNSGSLVLHSSLSSFGLVLKARDGEKYLERGTMASLVNGGQLLEMNGSCEMVLVTQSHDAMPVRINFQREIIHLRLIQKLRLA